MKKQLYFLPDLGILPHQETDCSDKLQEVLNAVEDNAVIHFQPGDYRVFKQIVLSDKSHIEIRGNSSRIIAHFDPCAPIANNNNVFRFVNCSDLEINGFCFDTDAPIGAAGEVTGINFDSGCVDVKIYDEFPVTGYEHFCGTNSFDDKGAPDYALATVHRLTEQEIVLPDGGKGTRLVGLDYTVVGDRTVRLKLNEKLPKKENCRLTVGHKMNLRYEVYGNTVFSFVSCHRVLMKNVVIYSAASFGVAVAPRSSDFTFDHFSICIKDGSQSLKATNADGIHILGLSGSLELKNCHIEGLGDDTLNIHSLAVVVTEVHENSVTVIGREQRLYPSIVDCTWADTGDVISVYDPVTFLRTGQFVVDEQRSDGTISFKDLTGTLAQGAVLANEAFYASVHMDGCVLRHTRARGILIQSQNVLIENCYIYGMSLAAMLFAPDIDFWWEVGPSKNVEIRNNIIEYCATIPADNNVAAIVFKASHDGDGTQYPSGVHDGIYIHDNYFKDIPNSALFVSSAKNVRIEENTFNNCCHRVRNPACAYAAYDIAVINCDNVEMSGNHSNRGEKTLVYTNE